MAKSPKSAVAVAVPSVGRLPLAEARAANAANVFVAGDKVVAAVVVQTAKGTNPKKVVVYGYDNLSEGGRVPKDKAILAVPGFTGCPKGVNPDQWDKLVALGKVIVSAAYDAGIQSGTVRRAYRAGAVRFAA